MGSWFVGDVTQGIAGTLRKAAKATGAGFDYLVKTAMRESSMDPAAKAKTSSAAGMFQFVEQTWFEMVKTSGPKYGLDAEAAAISKQANGRYAVADPQAKAKILALRHNTEISALMAGEFTANNKALMTSALRRPPSEGELYVAHFLGAQGSIDLIRLASATPQAKAADHFPDAARSNRSIFYAGGKPRSAADVLARLVNKHDKTPSAPVEEKGPLVAQAPASWFANAQPASGPELAYADDKPVFHSLFQTAKRPPVSPYVQGIWADLVPAAQAGKAAKKVDGKPLDLSTFLKPGVNGGA